VSSTKGGLRAVVTEIRPVEKGRRRTEDDGRVDARERKNEFGQKGGKNI